MTTFNDYRQALARRLARRPILTIAVPAIGPIRRRNGSTHQPKRLTREDMLHLFADCVGPKADARFPTRKPLS